MPGLFVSFEGGEACGKSTQVARLVQKLESMGRQVIAIREPGSTRAGEAIRNLLLHSEQALNLTPAAELLLFGGCCSVRGRSRRPYLEGDQCHSWLTRPFTI